jgi:hypothetical protein
VPSPPKPHGLAKKEAKKTKKKKPYARSNYPNGSHMGGGCTTLPSTTISQQATQKNEEKGTSKALKIEKRVER